MLWGARFWGTFGGCFGAEFRGGTQLEASAASAGGMTAASETLQKEQARISADFLLKIDEIPLRNVDFTLKTMNS